jgi:hypothetical protein
MSIETPNALSFIAVIKQNVSILASHQKGISFLMPLNKLDLTNYSHIRLLILQIEF